MVCVTGAGADVAAPRSALVLPAPTGPLAVGRTTLHLRDESRADFWVPEQRRELMVSLWYPTLLPIGTPAPYVTPQESALMVRALNVPGLPEDTFSTVRTHATVDAPPLPLPTQLVVLSPGNSLPRSTLTGLAEDLASRGYIAAAVDHTYEAVATTFPDGHTTECQGCQSKDRAGASRNRASDVSFVINQLTAPDPAWAGGRLIDPNRIAMVGHSMGGASAIPAMLADPRIRAGINMDGTVHVPADGLDRPFLLLGNPRHTPDGRDATWANTWSSLTGWKRWLTVTGSEHSAFTDIPLLFDQLGLPQPEGQIISGTRSLELTRAYVSAFLDQHLRAQPAPLLDGPSTQFPEVVLWP